MVSVTVVLGVSVVLLTRPSHRPPLGSGARQADVSGVAAALRPLAYSQGDARGANRPTDGPDDGAGYRPIFRVCAMPTVLLIRHAQASFGAVDYDLLSERGHEQVGALVAGLERRGIVADLVIAGGLRRQRETAAPCAAAVGRQVGIDERWNEYDDRDILTNYANASTGLECQAGDDVLSVGEFQQILNRALRQWIEAGGATA